MSLLLQLRCDDDRDGLCGTQLVTAHADADAARRYAARQGWTSTGGLDYCPRHNPESPQRPRVTPFDSAPHTGSTPRRC